jgi:pimeloyl-ACP methyl ester carboxylesterase
MGEHEELGPVADADLAAIAVPALVLVGDQDVALSRLCAGYLAAAIPGARHIVVDGADHYVSTAQPGEFLAVVRGFLAGRETAVPVRER